MSEESYEPTFMYGRNGIELQLPQARKRYKLLKTLGKTNKFVDGHFSLKLEDTPLSVNPCMAPTP